METLSALLAICAGNSPVPGEFPTQRPVTRSFDVYFDLRPDKRLSKQSWGWWFETLSHSLWRHRNVQCRLRVGHDKEQYMPWNMHTISAFLFFCHLVKVMAWWRHKMEYCPHYWPFLRGIHRSRWIPLTKAGDGELWCFRWSTPQRTVE